MKYELTMSVRCFSDTQVHTRKERLPSPPNHLELEYSKPPTYPEKGLTRKPDQEPIAARVLKICPPITECLPDTTCVYLNDKVNI